MQLPAPQASTSGGRPAAEYNKDMRTTFVYMCRSSRPLHRRCTQRCIFVQEHILHDKPFVLYRFAPDDDDDNINVIDLKYFADEKYYFSVPDYVIFSHGFDYRADDIADKRREAGVYDEGDTIEEDKKKIKARTRDGILMAERVLNEGMAGRGGGRRSGCCHIGCCRRPRGSGFEDLHRPRNFQSTFIPRVAENISGRMVVLYGENGPSVCK